MPHLFPDASFSRIGRWWDSEGELDVVGLDNSGRIISGESKFTTDPMHQGHLDTVEERAQRIEWTPPNKESVCRQFCLFSRSGFTDSVEDVAESRDDVNLFTVGDVIAALTA